MMNHLRIISSGRCLPDKILTNDELEQFPKSITQLIELKTGVRERRYALQNECTSDLAIKAALDCLSKINFSPSQLDAIILATSSPDRIQPATATRVQYNVQAYNAFAFDINSVCSGSVYGIALADSLIKAELCSNVLLIAAEVYSKIMNNKDFSTFPYFGDGAAAILFKKTEKKGSSIYSILKTDGSGADVIQIPAGGTMLPYLRNSKDIFFTMKGKEVFSFAVEKGSEIIMEILDKTNTNSNQIKYIVTHQANKNIIDEISKTVNIDRDKFYVNVEKYGNTAAASILIAVDELLSDGRLETGDIILTVGFGGGLSWGANLITI